MSGTKNEKANRALPGNLPAGLSQPALRALNGAGYLNLEALTMVRVSGLKKLHGMGPKGIELLREALAVRGLSFMTENEKDTK